MFTGIIETVGRVKNLKEDRENLDITIESSLASQLKVDQSVAHNGVCLTVVELGVDWYRVTAISETLEKTNLGALTVGQAVNLERAMKLGDRLDGHLVQGHVDQVGTCIGREAVAGSWIFSFQYDSAAGNITIEKGSITINGVSLTVVNSKKAQFSVAIIPYTYEHTNFNSIEEGETVNLEFDIIGKYLKRLSANYV
ncbi:MAG: riboflavin synthase [Flavobacteriaceae bacterium]|nr:riboflavin synthase [Flavobacteriaceae bacterium]